MEHALQRHMLLHHALPLNLRQADILLLHESGALLRETFIIALKIPAEPKEFLGKIVPFNHLELKLKLINLLLQQPVPLLFLDEHLLVFISCDLNDLNIIFLHVL
jgi:hypothetical protein